MCIRAGYVVPLTHQPSLVLEGGIFASHWIWLARTRKLRNEARLAGKNIEDVDFSADHTMDKEKPVISPGPGKTTSCLDLEMGSVESQEAAVSIPKEEASHLTPPTTLHCEG